MKLGDFIKILRVVEAFGIEGAMRVFLFTDRLKNYSKIFDENGNRFSFRIKKTEPKNRAVIFLEGITDRNAAESLRGAFFYLKQEQLPQIKDNEFYLCNLIGERVRVENTEIFCEIKSVQNYGAGDLIELSYGDRLFLVPFTKENFPDAIINDAVKICISEDAFRNFGTCAYKS